MRSSDGGGLGCRNRRGVAVAAAAVEQMLLFVGVSVIPVGPALVGVAVVAAAAATTVIELQVCPDGPKATE